MGQLVEGTWQRGPVVKSDKRGAFVRAQSGFRGALTADGRPGPDGRSFRAEPGRYHLYVSYACPFAHRTLLARALRGLTDAISCDVVEAFMGEDGWMFRSEGPYATAGATEDRVAGRTHLHQAYTDADFGYSGRVSVPVLWDKQTSTIVSNDSGDIMRMFDRECDAMASRTESLCPPELAAQIEQANQWLFSAVNNGVYRCGFATTQQAYEEAFDTLFATLDEVDGRLGQTRFLLGAKHTEADWRLFVTLVRFDVVYVHHFRCNRQRIADYPNLGPYLRDLYQQDTVASTVNIDHIKRHYYLSHPHLNPNRIVPKGPELDLRAPVPRERRDLGASGERSRAARRSAGSTGKPEAPSNADGL